MFQQLRSVLGALSLVAILLPWASPAAATVLKIATVSPDGAMWMREMREAAGEIAAQTQGRVTIKFYPGGVMGTSQSVLRKIRIGQLQGAAVTGGSLSKVYPDYQLYSLPFLFRSLDEVDYVRSRMDPVLVKGLERRGFVTFGLAEGGFAYMMSDKPLRSIRDLRGRRVWVPEGDNISRSVFEGAGVAPISLPLSDVLTGLQTGLIDTVATSPVAAIALQWHTRVRYITDAPASYFVALLIVEQRAFKKIDPSDQAIIREVMGRAFQVIDRQNRLDNESAREALKRQGIQLVQPSLDALARWQALAVDARQRLGAEGEYTPALLDTLLDHLAAYRQSASTVSAR